MLKNYLSTALRNLKRNKTYAAINVLGLALGITCSLLIFLVVKFELSFDAFHTNKENIYRINTTVNFQGEMHYLPNVPYPFIGELRREFPQIKKATVINYVYGGLVTIDNEGKTPRRFQEEGGITYVEPEFFDMFDYSWIQGNPAASLKEPRSVVITESQALKYFNEKAPFGKVLRLNNTLDLKVTGILKDFPANTDFPFTVLISYPTLKEVVSEDNLNSWVNLNGSVQGYVQLSGQTSPKELESKMVDFTKKYMPNDDPSKRTYPLQSLTSIHFDDVYGNYNNRTISKKTIWALGLIGFFMIVTACINFVNLATAQAVKRSKEIGVRKVLGSSRSQLFWQFIAETTVITFAALLFSILFTQLALPPLRDILSLDINFSPVQEPLVIIFIAVVWALVTLLSGSYPAFILSGYHPIQALKNKMGGKQTSGLSLRRGLVVMQFCISQVLIIGTIVVASQMDYFRNKPLGFNKDAVMTVHLPGTQNLNLESIRTQLMEHPGVEQVSFSNSSISSPGRQRTFFTYKNNTALVEEFDADIKFGDIAYLETYKLKLLAGRNLIKGDTIREYIVNESLVKKLGIKSPEEAIGKYISLWGRAEAPIVGVVQDFHMASFRESIGSCIITTLSRAYSTANIKLQVSQMQPAISHVEKIWRKAYPEHVFDYEFLDQTLANFYREEQKTAKLFEIFAGIAIFIGCLGLFGLISFITSQRTKEVGIRKVLGASVSHITLLFFKEFALLVLIAFLIASPIAYYLMHSWLEDFEYSINLNIGFFLIAGVASLVIAALTVGYQTIKAALANPVKSLRSE